MDINQAFPSKYIKAEDLAGQDVPVTIAHVQLENIASDADNGTEQAKPVLYFAGHTKGLILNKTNAHTIAGLYGYETDHWTGRQIVLFPTNAEFRGKSTRAVRVRATGAVAVPEYRAPATPAPVVQPQPVQPVQAPAGPSF